MSELRPFVLDPILVEKPWGGARFGDGSVRIGESWQVADLPAQLVSASPVSRTTVACGPWATATLRDLITRYGAELLGSASATPAGDFPLLVKVLDAAEHLSVQVHPTAAHVERHPDAVLKTESWFIVDALPDAVIYKGLRTGVERGDVERAAGTPAVAELIRPVPALPGEFHHLPAGLIHALGAGVVVAEIQTPSDTTYRLYDWIEEYDRPARALHVDSAVATLELDPPGVTHLPAAEARRMRRLTHNDHYSITEHIESRTEVALESEDELRLVMVLEGEVAIVHPDAAVVVGSDAVAVVPAAAAGETHLAVEGTARFLEVGLVSERAVD